MQTRGANRGLEQAVRYKVFGQHSGLRVAELFLGAGMFGTGWGHGAEREESRRMFDGYLQAGGNVLDTSDSYQFGESEACWANSSGRYGTISSSLPNTRRARIRRAAFR
jgi:aryl-alcohol dehydrogenase-like predicted oxidoreductase